MCFFDSSIFKSIFIFHPAEPPFNDTRNGLDARVEMSFRDQERPMRAGVNTIVFGGLYNYFYVNETYPQRVLGFVGTLEEVIMNIEFPSLQSDQAVW